MKKIITTIKFYLLLLFCFLFLNTKESLAQIPQFFNNNTSTPSNSFPWSTVAGKGIQSYFAPNQFPGAYNGNIMRAFWKVTPNVTTTYTSLTIKMGQTTNTTLDLGAIHSSTPLTTVYFAASVTLTSDANGWVNVVLQTPFTYNPVQALIVDVFNCAASNTGMIQCNYTAGGPSPVRTYINNSGCTQVYSGQDNNTACFGIDLQPLTPCGASITAGVTAGLANPCPGTTNIYGLVGSTLGTGLTYQWLSSPTGTAPWTPIPFATNQTYSMAAPASPIYIRCRMQCTSTLAFDSSASLLVNVLPWSPTSNCYCGNSNATITTFNDIGQFTFGNLINPLVTPTPQLNNVTAINGYTNFTSITPQFYIKGQNYPVSIYSISSSASQQTSYAKVFIDFNHNASFSDPGEEVFGDNINAANLFNSNGTINIPLTALPGVTRLRVVLWNTTNPLLVLPCGTYAYGETEDYLVNIVNQSINNPATTQVTIPAGNCFTNNETIFATIRNFGSSSINLNATNNIQAKLNVTGPLGTTSYTTTLTSGSLFANGVNSLTAIFNGVDMFDGGSYIINMDTFIVGGTLINAYNVDDSLFTPILVTNSRPTPGPSFTICQNSFIPFGQGLSVSGCTTPLLDSITYTFSPSQLVFGSQPCFPSSASMPGACWLGFVQLTAGNILPPGATIISAEQKLTNLATSNGGLASQARFPLYYGNTPILTNAFTPSSQGSALAASANFTWTNTVSNAVISNIFTTLGVGDSIKMAYHSTSATNATNNGFVLNAGSNPSEITLKVVFTYVPAAYEWYNVPTGGTSFYSFTPMNPIGIAGSGLNTTANSGTFSFYASCIGSSACRAKTDLIIIPSPTVIQDTLVACGSLFSSNVASFDLTQLNNSVSNNNPFATVEYYGDAGLFTNLIPYTNYPSSNSVIYSKVLQGSC